MSEPYWEPLAAAPAPPPQTYTLPGRLEAGSQPVPGANLNNAVQNGWYQVIYTDANAPLPLYGDLLVTNLDSTSVHQLVLTHTTNNMYRRQLSGAVWGAWEHVGPTLMGTALPGQPVDGQMYTLVDQLAPGPNYQWTMRWNKYDATGYPWRWVGGEPRYWQGMSYSTSAGSWQAPNIGSEFVCPKAGYYYMEVACTLSVPGRTRCYISASNASQAASPVSGMMQRQVTADPGNYYHLTSQGYGQFSAGQVGRVCFYSIDNACTYIDITFMVRPMSLAL